MSEPAQQIFDTVARHLFEQGERAVGLFGNCQYRGRDGKKCAVGCLITDEEYDPDIEGSAADARLFAELYPGLSIHCDLLCKLQNVHDDVCSWATTEEMRGVLRSVAEDCALSPVILDTLQFGDGR